MSTLYSFTLEDCAYRIRKIQICETVATDRQSEDIQTDSQLRPLHEQRAELPTFKSTGCDVMGGDHVIKATRCVTAKGDQ